MRSSFVLALVALSGCDWFVVANPNVCCVSDARCEAINADEPRPCRVGQACGPDFTCIAAECDTSADCPDPAAPVCQLNLCVGTCEADADCADVAGRPICSADNTCVGCETADQCSAEAPLCDAEDRACRGCERDGECASGVCLEADARCAETAEVVFVDPNGTDAGDCVQGAPCRTLGFALGKVSSTRSVVHTGPGTLVVPSTLTINVPVHFDARDTTIRLIGTAPLLRVTSLERTVFSHLRIDAGTARALEVASSSATRLFDVAMIGSATVEGALDVERTQFEAPGINNQKMSCTSGTLSIRESTFRNGVESNDCNVTVTRSVFDDCSGSVRTRGGLVVVENNLFIETGGFTDSARVSTAAPGSVVRFNTFVNTTTIPSDGVALECDPTVDVTSNVFAYHSRHPFNMCGATHSLLDSTIVPEQASGVGNVVADRASFFVDLAGRNFRLAPASPAIGKADPSLTVTTDLDGNPRPQPAGSTADVGAFEAP